MGKIRIGVSGWSYDESKGGFCPEDLPDDEQLEFSARVFDNKAHGYAPEDARRLIDRFSE